MFSEKPATGFWFSSTTNTASPLLVSGRRAAFRLSHDGCRAPTVNYTCVILLLCYNNQSKMKELLLKMVIVDDMIGAAYDEGIY